MQLNKLYPAKGSTHPRKKLGMGYGTGHGASSTRGGKGQTARSGSVANPVFEGGQMPLVRRIPKRGFTNGKFRKEYRTVNIGDLEKRFEAGAEITLEALFDKNLLNTRNMPVKILGDGSLTKKFTVKAQSISKSAEQKIKACGGTFEKIQ